MAREITNRIKATDDPIAIPAKTPISIKIYGKSAFIVINTAGHRSLSYRYLVKLLMVPRLGQACQLKAEPHDSYRYCAYHIVHG